MTTLFSSCRPGSSLAWTFAGMLLAAALPAQAQNAPLTGTMASPSPVVSQRAPATAASVAQAPATAAPLAQAPAPAPNPGVDASTAPPRPVVRQSAAAPAPAAAPAQAVPAERSRQPASQQLGDVTRLLLAAQADGRRGGADLPMLGVAADRAWQRYMDSFSQPIPQWFDERVQLDE